MKTLDQTHLINFGFESLHGNVHVQFNKYTAQIETLTVTDSNPGSGFLDITNTFSHHEITQLKAYAYNQYKQQHGHLPKTA